MPLHSRRFLLALAGTSLTGSLLSSRIAKAANPPKKPIAPEIGVALPLSGDFSLIGNECQRGILLAADAANAAGGIAGKPIQLTPADILDPGQASHTVNDLNTKNHAGLILGSGTSALSYPSSAAAELAQIPYIELNAPADGITTRGFKFLLRTGPTTSMIANLAAATLQARFKGRKIGLLFNTGATGGAIASAAIAAFTAAKTPILLAQGYPEDTTDLQDPVARLKRAGVRGRAARRRPRRCPGVFRCHAGAGLEPGGHTRLRATAICSAKPPSPSARPSTAPSPSARPSTRQALPPSPAPIPRASACRPARRTA